MSLNFPKTVDVRAMFRHAYELIDVVGDEVTLLLRNDSGTYDSVGPLKAKVSELRVQDLIGGSTARVGDLKAILRAQSIPPGQRRLEAKDRVLWQGRHYAVVQYDDATARIGTEVLGVSIILRG
jgi:hypothetical protein